MEKNEIEERNKGTLEPLMADRHGNEKGVDVNLLTAGEIEALKEDENPLRINRIIFILFLEVIVVIDQFFEGNAKLPSLIGIARCSGIYWLVFSIHVLISLFLLIYAYRMVKKYINQREQTVPNFKDEKMKKLNERLYFIVFMAIIAGIVSSMVGIGGGMITNPMFASLGLDPKESSSTSNFLIITTAIASTFLFSFAGQLNYSYSIWMMIPCTISAFIGSFFILEYINKTHKSSILLDIMDYFLLLSLIIILFRGYFYLRTGSFMDIFTLNSFCS